MNSQAPIRRVLVVEDEALLAMLLEDCLAELGCEVIGPAMRLDRALLAARDEAFDLAILDVNLAGQHSAPVADVLVKRGIPFLFATGYGVEALEERHRGAVLLRKPYALEDLARAMQRAV